ncbi:MAG: AMP-binding protein [Planctomycetota bacterium]|nr:AMP-binding protein [Planctomycetota bacterium]MDA0921485.1 AMP-binding protein [Planctomycetota bacterium]MDA1160113.1 AMP-binding protein [Planctomycetota bacterium]
METVPFESARDFADSPFPVTPIFGAATASWHQSYPPGIPPEIQYTPRRVEQLLQSAVERYPDRVSLRYFRTSHTYQELLDRVRQTAGAMRELGIGTGDRVMLVLPNSPEFVIAWFAIHWLGAEAVPANPLMSAAELTGLARKCGIQAVLGLDVRMKPVAEMASEVALKAVIVTSLAPHLPLGYRLAYTLQKLAYGKPVAKKATKQLRFEELASIGRPIAEPLLDDPSLPAVLQPTGGTTGSPKVAVLAHKNLCANVAQLHVWSGLEPGCETFLSVLPFFHVYGATCAMLSPLVGGSTLILQARFHPKRTLGLMDKYQPGIALLVPFMIASLNDEMRKRGKALKGLRLCMSGASAMSGEVGREFEHLTGATIIEGFGLSEASPVTHSNPSDGTARIGSIGLPLPNTYVRLVDLETGTREVEFGEIGELIIKGPQIMQGYLDDPEETAIALRDGWLFTGDLATVTRDGFFEIVDRKKDMIISGGLNVYPSEVEEIIREHSAVESCAVVGVPDRKYGELVCAWVVPSVGGPPNLEELKSFCRERLSGYKVPREFRVCDALPENFLGKVRRIDLRNRAA